MKAVSVGDVFIRLRVVSEVIRVNGRSCVHCECKCGKFCTVPVYRLLNGNTKSCGCLRSDQTRARSIKHGCAVVSRRTSEYKTWLSMKDRCTNPNNKKFRYYGGRGIAVCHRWSDSFESFLSDMGPRPSPKHSIDRHPNRDGNYEPGNCRWATEAEQKQNTRRYVLLTLNGETMGLREWAARSPVGYNGLRDRLKKMSLAEALARPLSKRGRHASIS